MDDLTEDLFKAAQDAIEAMYEAGAALHNAKKLDHYESLETARKALEDVIKRFPFWHEGESGSVHSS